MSHLIERPTLLHRACFPGEISLFTCTATGGELGAEVRVTQFETVIQHFEDPEEKFQIFKHGSCELTSRENGEPYTLSLVFEGDGIEAGQTDPFRYIRQYTADLAYFLGNELASELVGHMVDQYRIWVEAGSPFDTPDLRFKFADMRRYNELFMQLCELISREAGAQFARAAKAREFIDFWNKTETNVNVGGQRAWYSQHGPMDEGETQADYDAEVRAFEELVLEGQRAARELVSA